MLMLENYYCVAKVDGLFLALRLKADYVANHVVIVCQQWITRC